MRSFIVDKYIKGKVLSDIKENDESIKRQKRKEICLLISCLVLSFMCLSSNGSISSIYNVKESNYNNNNNNNSNIIDEHDYAECQYNLLQNELDIVSKYISSLDLWIISHGGIGSNALIGYLNRSSSITVWRNKELYEQTCHFGEANLIQKIRPSNDPPILIVMGDIWNSMVSQHRRGYLTVNLAKNRYGTRNCKWYKDKYPRNYSFYLQHYPNDPVNIKSMMQIYSNMNNTVFVKAPYTKQSIIEALIKLNFNNAGSIMSQFVIKQRPKEHIYPINSVDALISLYQPYIKFQARLDQMPQIW